MAMASDDNIRCAQCTFVVLHIFPEIMQDLLAATEVPPSVLYRMIKNNPRINLKKYERITVQTMTKDGFTKLDISVMYKIIKFFKLICPPTRNWGANPLPNETELGDDIERIKKARNYLVHKYDANVSEKSFTEFFENSITVSKRFDKYFRKPEGCSYEERIQRYKSCLLDKTAIEQLLEEGRKEESLKTISTCSLESQQKEVHIMTGKSMNDVLESVKSIAGETVSPIKIIIHGINCSDDNVDVINSFKNELSSDNITFKRAEKSCIILFADIRNKALHDHLLFVKEVNCLIKKVFRLCKLTCKGDELAYAVVISAEEEFDQHNLEEIEKGGPSLFGNDDNLVLHADIKNSTFLSDERVEQVFTKLFDTVAKIGNGQQFLGKKAVHAVLVPEEEDETFQYQSVLLEKRHTKDEESILMKETEKIIRKRENELHNDVKYWIKIRTQTLSRIDDLYKKLRVANQKIGKAKLARHFTAGLAVVGGAFCSVLTGGESMVGALVAEAITARSTGIKLKIEAYVANDVLIRTLQAINNDQFATFQLLTRVGGTHKIPFADKLPKIKLEGINDLAKDPLEKFMSSFVDADSSFMLKPVDKILQLRVQLEQELQQIERIQGQHSLW